MKVIKSYLVFRMSECKHMCTHMCCEGKSCVQRQWNLKPELVSVKECCPTRVSLDNELCLRKGSECMPLRCVCVHQKPGWRRVGRCQQGCFHILEHSSLIPSHLLFVVLGCAHLRVHIQFLWVVLAEGSVVVRGELWPVRQRPPSARAEWCRFRGCVSCLPSYGS